MKTKNFFRTAVLTLTILFLNTAKSFGQCETTLPNDLQNCFNSNGLDITVTVSSGTAYLSGTLSGNSQFDDFMVCYDSYINSALSCTNAPVLDVSSIVVNAGSSCDQVCIEYTTQNRVKLLIKSRHSGN